MKYKNEITKQTSYQVLKHVGVDTWYEVCFVMCLYLIHAFCWLFENTEGICLFVTRYEQSVNCVLIHNKMSVTSSLQIQVLHFLVSSAFPFPFTAFVVLNLKYNVKYEQYSFVAILFEISCMLWFFRLTVKCESMLTTKLNKGVYPSVYSHGSLFFSTWNIYSSFIHTLMRLRKGLVCRLRLWLFLPFIQWVLWTLP